MSDADFNAPSLRQASDFRWAGVDLRRYKEENAAPFKAVTRQILFSDPRLLGELRYFEVEPGGYSTLERHEHMHAVMILRGGGEVLIGDKIHPANAHDLVTIPPWTWHQFRPTPGETLGFLCMVNAERDRPQLPTAEELEILHQSPAVARFLEGESSSD